MGVNSKSTVGGITVWSNDRHYAHLSSMWETKWAFLALSEGLRAQPLCSVNHQLFGYLRFYIWEQTPKGHSAPPSPGLTHTHTHRFHSFTHTHTHTHIDFTLSHTHTHTHTYTHTSISLFPPEQSSEEKWKTILSSVNSARFLATNLQFSPQLQGPHSFLKGQVEQNLEKKISKNDIHCYVFSCSNILLLLYPKSRLSWHFKCISYLINRGINTKVLLILKGIIE